MTACGGSGAPNQESSLQPSAALTTTPAVTPTLAPTPSLVTCPRGPGAAMAAVAGQFVYDVSDPVHPRLICRSTTFSFQTSIHLLDSHAISYINLDGTQVIVVRHDLITGAETVIARLPADPRGYPSAWTSDGTLEAYAWGEQVHLWSGGADHLLYTLKPHGPVGFESRWNGPWKLVQFSPDHAYLAISYLFDVVHIFSVSDGRELLAIDTGYAQGGTC